MDSFLEEPERGSQGVIENSEGEFSDAPQAEPPVFWCFHYLPCLHFLDSRGKSRMSDCLQAGLGIR